MKTQNENYYYVVRYCVSRTVGQFVDDYLKREGVHIEVGAEALARAMFEEVAPSYATKEEKEKSLMENSPKLNATFFSLPFFADNAEERALQFAKEKGVFAVEKMPAW